MTASRTVVLVEGDSDQVALRTLARRLGRDLDAEGVEIVAMGGITNTRAYATKYGPRGLGLRLAGLYDAPDEAKLRRGLAASGVASMPTREDLPRLGFYPCSLDLEDELIRALGIDRVERVIEETGEARSLHLLATMPAQRDWTRRQIIRRFLGSKSGRKSRYAELLVEAVPLDRAPRPLTALLATVHP